MTAEFQTKDLYFSAFLYAKGTKLVRVNRMDGVCWFMFEDSGKCARLQKQYLDRSGQVGGKEFADAVLTLKNYIFSNQ